MTSEVRKQITVLSGKGGTGKTTFTAVLAQLSSPYSLLADCDVDAPNLHLLLDPTNTSSEQFMSGKLAIKDPQKCIECGKCLEVCRYDAVSTDFEIDATSCEGCGACAWSCPVEAITMELQASGKVFEANTRFGPLVHARLNIGAENSGKLVSEVIQKSHIKAEQMDKELVIVDGSPGIGCPVVAALTNASLVIIVVEPTLTAIHDMKRVVELARFINLQPAIIINKSTINKDQRNHIREYCEKDQIPILGELPYEMEFYHAMVNGKTILEYEISGMKEPLDTIWMKIQEILQLKIE